MEFFTKKRKKKLQCCLWVSSDALSHLKINSEVRNASLLPFSALFCLCSVHDILHWVSCTVTQQWICLGVSWEEIQSLHISFMPSLYSWNPANTGGRAVGKKDYTEEGWMKPRWTQGRLQRPQFVLPQAQRQTQDLSEPTWVCSGSLPWQLCPGAVSFWPLLSNSLGCQCCSPNDVFFTGLFQLCFLMQLSQISLGPCQKKKKKDFSILKVLCLSLPSELVMLLTMTS